MSRKSLVFIVILLALVGGFSAWRIRDMRVRAEILESQILDRLSVEDIGLIIKSQAESDPQAPVAFKENPDARRAFLKSLSVTLALAAEARREGLAEDQDFKINLEYQKDLFLQKLYMEKLFKGQGKEFYKPEEVEAVWNDPENEARFRRDIASMEAINDVYAKSRELKHLNIKFEGEKLEKARKEWARIKVFSDKAKAHAEFIQRPEVQLRLKIVEAGNLAYTYLNKHWQKDIKANDAEIRAYLAAHPEYDLSKKREKAEMVLKRAKAGEDFSKLAAEFSEDRSTKSKGGLYENVGRNILWIEVENAALAMAPGQIADKLIESHNGFHIVKLEGKHVKKEKDGSETVQLSVRHILLQNAFEERNSPRPDIPPPFMKPEEIAKAEVEKEKYNVLVAALIQRNQITVPDDFP